MAAPSPGSRTGSGISTPADGAFWSRGTHARRPKWRAATPSSSAPGWCTAVAACDKLELDESFDRAWRRVGLALDRVGFTVEDRDRSKGYYFVRYVDPQIDGQKNPENDKGFLSKLAFWKTDKSGIKAEQYRVVVKEANTVSDVQVQDKDGQQDNSDTGRRILSLLHDQLK